MSCVFVLDTNKQPLNPVHPGWARKLLSSGRAAVYKRYPFTIILKSAVQDAEVQPLRLKIDPGSNTTGLTIVNDDTGDVAFAAELNHRGQLIKKSMDTRRAIRRSRRNRKTRYRKPRFSNRRRQDRWLAPSLRSRLENIETWIRRLRNLCPITSISLELVKFDTQAMQNPEIQPIVITAMGRGNRQMCRVDKYGFPRTSAKKFKRIHGGVAVHYEDKKQVIPVVQNINSFEYDLTSAILKVASPEEKTIGFLTGHDEHDIYDDEKPDGYGRMREALQKQYSVTAVDTTNGKKVNDNINTLIIAGPKKTLSERDKYEIDQFIMRGGRAIFLIDSIQAPAGSVQATPLSTGLNDLLQHYGVKLGNNLVVDSRSHATATFGSRFYQITQPYPLFPKVRLRRTCLLCIRRVKRWLVKKTAHRQGGEWETLCETRG